MGNVLLDKGQRRDKNRFPSRAETEYLPIMTPQVNVVQVWGLWGNEAPLETNNNMLEMELTMAPTSWGPGLPKWK